MSEQWTQFLMEGVKCLRCGYCCKKATCMVGIAHGAEPKNCMYLVGDEPGNYSCFLVDHMIYDCIDVDLAIGEGCCEPLNSIRNDLENQKFINELLTK